MKMTVLAATLAVALLSPVFATAATTTTQTAAATANPPAVWDLTPLYPTTAAWDAERLAIVADLPALKARQGTLGKDPQSLAAALGQMFDLRRRMWRMEVYASLQADANTLDDAAQSRAQQAYSVDAQLDEAASFINPEISAIGADKIDAWLKQEPALGQFSYFIQNALRLTPHTLDARSEALLAAAQRPLDGTRQVFDLLTNADLPFPKITVRGKTYTLDQGTYTLLRADIDPKVRQQVFKAFWSVFKAYERTLGASYAGHIRGEIFKANARHYASVLDMKLANENTPDAVYKTLIAETNAGLPTLHRYLKLRTRLLGLKQAGYPDVYVPLTTKSPRYTLAQAEATTLKAVAPLGQDYVNTLASSFGKSWMHAQPQRGKQSGAYMNGAAYDVHPFVLMTFNGDYESMSTVAHEWGHAMHTVLANGAQPFPTADYSIFVAEIPSTTNEMLLADYVADHASTKAEKVFALNQELELLRATFFRQAMFAEFEYKAHEALEQDKALSGSDFSKIYLDLLKRYQGDAEGVMHIDDLYGSEWEFVSHFYNDFYVYQYATSISAAAYFAEGIEKGDLALRDRYFTMLKSGGSADPYQIVKRAGVDLASPEPYRAVIRRMNKAMDEIEALTAQK
ncbi:oligoendopeptidase F [Silvimonas iriomotensis]|uniref:Oligopeptidase F n=1 Tax=Silvimonas iriomotensis TaxID=449662 RepID=A0ABQ2P4L0_9NEIS|nr:oligoendopeptidase F [Silvimonas iriomotensis]GGP18212.1 oligoendopeptidase F [Silvimonas iriomotensis]